MQRACGSRFFNITKKCDHKGADKVGFTRILGDIQQQKEFDEMEEMRINKYLSDVGVCSRREADRFLEAGKITVDGQIAVMGQKVTGTENICIKGVPIKKEEKKVLLAFHKPKGIVCTTSKKDKDNIVDYINYGQRIYPVGRLDKESEGLILLTNRGELSDQLLRGSNGHEKEYLVTVNRRITKDFLYGMANGVPILDRVTRSCKVTPVDDYTFKIILTQGWNRQIRRMCEYFNYRVRRLIRIRIMNIELGDLPVGKYREIKGKEEDLLLAGLAGEKHTPSDIRKQSDKWQSGMARQEMNEKKERIRKNGREGKQTRTYERTHRNTR